MKKRKGKIQELFLDITNKINTSKFCIILWYIQTVADRLFQELFVSGSFGTLEYEFIYKKYTKTDTMQNTTNRKKKKKE